MIAFRTDTALRRAGVLLALTLFAFVGATVASPASPAAAAQSGSLLYTPDLSTFPNATADYPRAIRLEHDGLADQTMLATFAQRYHNAPSTLPIYRSLDGGQNWTQVSTVSSNTPGWDLEAPTLFEVPRTINGLDQGDLLAAGTA